MKEVPVPSVKRSMVWERESKTRSLPRLSVRPPVRVRDDVPCRSTSAVLKLVRFREALFSVAVVAPVMVRTWPVEIIGVLAALFRTTVESVMVAFPVRLTVRSLGAAAFPKF